MLQAMPYRGPDACISVEFQEEDIQLGHLRLSIIDLDSRSHQPMQSADGRYAIVLNGEIYNFVELRAELEKDGQVFRTTSDTEVLLYWLVRFGTDRIHELDGMFAFCFLDRERQELLLVRDHIGEKPLFVASSPGHFAFASEIPALTTLSWVDRRLDKEALRDYLFFLYAAPPRTFYCGIREVMPGTAIRYSLATASVSITTYFDLVGQLEIRPTVNTYTHDVATFREEFSAAVHSRLVADVPVSLYLSGGLDSNAVAGVIGPEVRSGMLSFTMSYGSDANARVIDEGPIAAECARFHGVGNVAARMSANPDLPHALAAAIDLFGQPFGNPTPLIAAELSREVAKHGKVCLSGDGGDELLVGYPRYMGVALADRLRHLPSAIFHILRAAAELLPESGRWATQARRVRQFLEVVRRPPAESYLHWVGYADVERINSAVGVTGETEFYSRLKAVFSRFDSDPVRAAQIVDFVSFVPFNLMQAADRSSMVHSVELRSPFLARKLVVTMLGMASRNKRAWLRKKPLLQDALDTELPPFIRRQPKRPFNPPMSDMIRSNLDWIDSFLMTPGLSQTIHHVAPEFLRAEIDAFRDRRRENSTYLWAMCVLECWLRTNMHEKLPPYSVEESTIPGAAMSVPNQKGSCDTSDRGKTAVSTNVVHRQLLIGSLPPPVGGTTVLLAQLVRDLGSRQDFSLDICDSAHRGDRSRLSVACKMLWACVARAPKADSVAFHGSLRGVMFFSPILALVCRVLRKKFLVRIFGGSLDGALEKWPALLTIGFRRIVLRRSVVLYETRKGVERLRQMGGVHVVWYPNSRPMARKRSARNLIAGEPLRLVYVGHVRHEKGIGELVEAVKRLNGEAVVDIYGPVFSGVAEESLTTRYTTYRGSVDPAAVLDLLQGYDALVLPTYYTGEGYPGVVLEAYSVGIPVITTNWQCIPEIVSRKSGILVPPRDVSALVAAIKALHDGRQYPAYQAGAAEMASFFESGRWSDLYVELSAGRENHTNRNSPAESFPASYSCDG